MTGKPCYQAAKLTRDDGSAIVCLYAANGAAGRQGFNSALVRERGLPLFLPRASLVHMRTSLALDLVFITRKGRVKKIFSRVRPGLRLYGALAANCLEFPAGEAERLGIRVGEKLALTFTS